MAKKSSVTQNLDLDVAKELEEALDFDLAAGADELDIAASMEDLEAQISQAADELARESRAEKMAQNATPAPAARPASQPAPAAADLRPVETSPARPSGLSPANDDQQRDYRTMLNGINRRSSGGIYWMIAVLSLLWVGGGFLLANVLFTPPLLEIRSIQQVLAQPYLILLASPRSCPSSCSGPLRR